jgi:hypothetical protein
MPTQREKIIKPKLILREIAENIDLEELGHN